MNAEQFRIHKHAKIVLSLFFAAGLIALCVAFSKDAERAWSTILVNQFYFVSIALGGTFLIAVQYVSNASWGTGLRRIPEAMTAYLPTALLLGLVMVMGIGSLYHWSHQEAVATDELLRHKLIYLNIPGFIGRMIFFIGIWILFSKLIVRNSRQQDITGDRVHTKRNVKYSAIFIPVFALTYTFASYDWMMSLEPHWFSTIFSIYTFSSLFLHGVGMVTLIVLILLASGYLKGVVNENHLHDLGKLIFAFSTFWAYCWFCQYMLIWYANIPEETAYFLNRHEGKWFAIFIINLFLNWIVPFFLLMPRSAKRSQKMLWIVSILLLVAHWLDVYLMVYPSTLHYPKLAEISEPTQTHQRFHQMSPFCGYNLKLMPAR